MIHHLYGIDVDLPWSLTGVPGRPEGPCDVHFFNDDGLTLDGAAALVPPEQADWWAQHASLPDGSSYRRWTDLFDFLVSADGRRIHARLLAHGSEEALLAYLLVDALSFSMVRLGWEPLHATALATPYGVAAFLGESGEGKSTMGALFIQGGSKLVADDMLALEHGAGQFTAHAGPPRIKLYREMATRIFGSDREGVPMNPVTEKLIIRLAEGEMAPEGGRLAALYFIGEAPPGEGRTDPVIQRLAPAAALPRVLSSTAAHHPSDPERLKRQFDFVTRLVLGVPVKTLSYHRNTSDMGRVRDAVLEDLAQ